MDWNVLRTLTSSNFVVLLIRLFAVVNGKQRFGFFCGVFGIEYNN